MQAQLIHHLETLCVAIGARPIGSLANQRAADYIRTVFHAAGLAVEEQAYPCTGWRCSGAWLDLAGETLPVEANAFSPACAARAPVVPVANLGQLAAADLTGKIALLHGELARDPLSPKSWFLKSERDDAIIGLLEAKQPAALLAPPPSTPYYEQFTSDWEFDLPAATTPPAVIERLLAFDGLLELRLDCARFATTARNIVARRPGAAPPGSARVKAVLMAHFDTRINTPGAVDNGGGTAVLLTLAQTLASVILSFDLEFVAFNGEEYLPMGDDEYVRRAGAAAFDAIWLALNLDGVGPANGHNTIAQFNLTPAASARLTQICARFAGLQWVEPWPESNHSTFAFRGVPALALSSSGATAVAHFPTDTLTQISGARLAEAAASVQAILSDAPLLATAARSPAAAATAAAPAL